MGALLSSVDVWEMMMSRVSEQNRFSINELITSYKELPWYKKWFFPRNLKDALVRCENVELTSELARNVCSAFLMHTTSFHRWFFNCVNVFDKEPILHIVKSLEGHKLFSSENFDASVEHQHPEQIACTLKLLSGLDIEQVDFHAIVKHHRLEYFVYLLKLLHEAHLLTGDKAKGNFRLSVRHLRPGYVAYALNLLNDISFETLLNGCGLIRMSSNPEALSIESLRRLLGNNPSYVLFKSKAYYVNSDCDVKEIKTFNFEALNKIFPDEVNTRRDATRQNLIKIRSATDHNPLPGEVGQTIFKAILLNPKSFGELLKLLKDIGDIGEDTLRAILVHEKLGKGIQGLYLLKNANLLTRTTAQAFIKNEDIETVVDTLQLLKYAGLLTLNNLDLIDRYTGGLWHLNRMLEKLSADNLLTGELEWQYVFNTIIQHQSENTDFAGSFSAALRLFNEVKLFTGPRRQDNFHALLRNSAILFHGEIADLWFQISSQQLTQERFDQLIKIIETPSTGQGAIFTYVNRELISVKDSELEGDIHRVETTQKANVHKSVSESAVRLMNRYGPLISGRQLDILMKALSTWIDALSENVAAAKKTFQRITAPDYFFMDIVSQISTKQLLALSFLAIHDESLRRGGLGDAKEKLIAGLCQGQLESNMFDTHEDLSGADLTIGGDGAYTKIMEQLDRTLPDVFLNSIHTEESGQLDNEFRELVQKLPNALVQTLFFSQQILLV